MPKGIYNRKKRADPAALPKPLPLFPEEKEVLSSYKLPVSEWAEKYRILSKKTTRFYGKWSHDLTPFLIEIMDSLSNPDVRQVTVLASSQSGKTEVLLNFLGYTVDQNPLPILIVMPTENDCRRRILTRVKPLFESTPCLQRRLKNANGILAGDPTVLTNCIIYFAWAGSTSALADNPCGVICLDETGKFPLKVGLEADPVSLAKDRTTTFGDQAKIYVASSPVVENDLIDREFKAGDMREWFVKCKFCEQFHVMRWENVFLAKMPDGSLLEPEDYLNSLEVAYYVCPNCKKSWTEADRWEAICAGEWRAANPKSGRIRSYHISSLMLSPNFVTIGQLASEWAAAIKAKKAQDLGPLQNFLNSRLAESWQESEKVTEQPKLNSHIGKYPMGRVPAGVQMLVAGIDVQQDFCWVNVIGFGYLSECWLIYSGRLETGDTSKLENLEVLRRFLTTPWPSLIDEKRIFHIVKSAIDVGFRPDTIYDFIQKTKELDITACRGDDSVEKAAYRASKVLGGTLQRFDLNVNQYKNRIYRLLYENEVPGPGYLHLYADPAPEVLEQLSSEEQAIIHKRGSRVGKLRWVVKKSGAANHAWDALVYATFAGELAGARSLPSPQEIQAAIQRREQQRKNKKQHNAKKSDYWENVPNIEL